MRGTGSEHAAPPWARHGEAVSIVIFLPNLSRSRPESELLVPPPASSKGGLDSKWCSVSTRRKHASSRYEKDVGRGL